jgi:hypothetical protein
MKTRRGAKLIEAQDAVDNRVPTAMSALDGTDERPLMICLEKLLHSSWVPCPLSVCKAFDLQRTTDH